MNQKKSLSINYKKHFQPLILSIYFIVELITNKDIESSSLEQLDSVSKWINQCYNKPNDIEIKMDALNELLEGHGVESIRMEEVYLDSYWSNTIGLYVNMGDTYNTTIVYSIIDDSFLLTSWGDYYEDVENTKENFS